MPVVHGKVFVGKNSNIPSLGLQIPRVMRVVWAWLDSCALTACQRASSPIDGRVLILAGIVAEFALAMKESRQARIFMLDNVMSVGGSLPGGRL